MSTIRHPYGIRSEKKKTTLQDLKKEIEDVDFVLGHKIKIAKEAEKEYRKTLNVKSAKVRAWARTQLNRTKYLKKAKEAVYIIAQSLGYK